MTVDPKVLRILQWRESLSTLPDDKFFDIMKIYLGDIKTPFNKQKLVEQLSSFLAREENISSIKNLLSQWDAEIISAVYFIPDLTIEKLVSFFSTTYTYSVIYEKITNLEERLILYRQKNTQKNINVIKINPLLESTLNSFISLQQILPLQELTFADSENTFFLSSQVIASFISFAAEKKDLCKADGTLKKKTVSELEKIFCKGKSDTQIISSLELLTKALSNLLLIYEGTDGIFIDYERLENFCNLNECEQKLYICVASTGHFARNTLQKNAQFLLEFLKNLSGKYFTRELLKRLAFLLQTRNAQNSTEQPSRFARMLARSTDEEFSEQSALSVIDAVIDSAIEFGFISSAGKNEKQETLYTLSTYFADLLAQKNTEDHKKLLSIDASFTVTVMPGLLLRDLLILTKCMNCISCDLTALYEISKKSFMRAFDLGLDVEKLLLILQKYSLYELPQNLKVSAREWYASYSSASIYKGYVLKVNEENKTLVEKNPVLSPFIKIILAPGVFLLNVQSDEEIKNIIAKSGLDFLGTIKEPPKEKQILSLPKISFSCQNNFLNYSAQENTFVNPKVASLAMESLKLELDKMDITKEQKEELEERIKRKMILTKEQLRPSTVTFERLEAGGMDFAGKLHILTNAISSQSLVVIEMEGEKNQLTGKPLALLNRGENVQVRIKLQDSEDTLDLLVAKLTNVKKLRPSFFI